MVSIDDVLTIATDGDPTLLTIQRLLQDTEDILLSKIKAREEMRSDAEIALEIHGARLERVFATILIAR